MVGPSSPMIVHNCAYGAGVGKLAATLELSGIYLTYEEVQTIHQTYWDVFSGVKDYSNKLYTEWRQRGGYIINGLGRPIAVAKDMTKDILNRCIQSTGHDILTTYLVILCNMLDNNNIDWKPIILDFHDASTVEVPEADGPRVMEIFLEALAELNRRLGGSIPLRGVPVMGYSLADVKEPEE